MGYQTGGIPDEYEENAMYAGKSIEYSKSATSFSRVPMTQRIPDEFEYRQSQDEDIEEDVAR